jgi:hypothetical protein
MSKWGPSCGPASRLLKTYGLLHATVDRAKD